VLDLDEVLSLIGTSGDRASRPVSRVGAVVFWAESPVVTLSGEGTVVALVEAAPFAVSSDIVGEADATSLEPVIGKVGEDVGLTEIASGKVVLASEDTTWESSMVVLSSSAVDSSSGGGELGVRAAGGDLGEANGDGPMEGSNWGRLKSTDTENRRLLAEEGIELGGTAEPVWLMTSREPG
jgi:hypothetical protein